eukprot:8039177-Pyramimonas_sp.AAC.1
MLSQHIPRQIHHAFSLEHSSLGPLGNEFVEVGRLLQGALVADHLDGQKCAALDAAHHAPVPCAGEDLEGE